ncbi:serine/threonine protein kinase, partial [candidate division KSB1 bacterium]|nr:serine/threonine protein kinase [candidate division KSB1 bacterium]
MIGKIISHYKILEKLGAGAMGVVYKAQDLKLDRLVALKFLPTQIGQGEEEKARFIHEAKAASALEHNNICNIHEIDQTEDGQMFIAMAYYEGQSLKEKIERGPLPIEEALEIAIQIAAGLVKAHSKDIIHRDIKPANILITEDDIVKIVDFGLAKLAGR